MEGKPESGFYQEMRGLLEQNQAAILFIKPPLAPCCIDQLLKILNEMFPEYERRVYALLGPFNSIIQALYYQPEFAVLHEHSSHYVKGGLYSLKPETGESSLFFTALRGRENLGVGIGSFSYMVVLESGESESESIQEELKGRQGKIDEIIRALTEDNPDTEDNSDSIRARLIRCLGDFYPKSVLESFLEVQVGDIVLRDGLVHIPEDTGDAIITLSNLEGKNIHLLELATVS